MTTNGPVSEGGSKSDNSGCGIAFGLVFALVGVVVLFFAARSTLLAIDAGTWEETSCEIQTAQLSETHSDDGTSYRADFTYSYQFEGKKYLGERDSVMGSYGRRKFARARLDSLPVGTETVCYVDPDEPAEAVLDTAFPTWSVLALSAFGLIFGGIGCVIAYGGFNQRRLHKRKQASPFGHLDSISEQEYFQTEVVDRDHEPGQQTSAGLTSSDAANVRGHGGAKVHPADIKDREADVPQRLRSESSRWGKLIGATLAALFWNGIVSVFVWNMLFEVPPGGFKWGLGLFLTPFVLIGLLLIAGVIHSFVSLFNPTVSIALSTGAVSRGGELDVAWEISGGIRNINHLKINVVGTEWARYQRGTSMVIDESTFEIVPVAALEEKSEIRFGSVTVVMPAETMHTLDQTNNKIKWAVVVTGEIAWWPNVTGDYPFRLTPRLQTGTTTSAAGVKNG